MYTKNLTEDFRLRVSETDMNFLRALAEERCTSISEVVRSIIGEYRRAQSTMETLKQALAMAQEMNAGKEGTLSDGDTKSDFDNLV